jgi:hypothetical protein
MIGDGIFQENTALGNTSIPSWLASKISFKILVAVS